MSNPSSIQHVGAWYMRKSISNHRKTVQKAVRVLAQHKKEFDVLVGTGVSGTLLLTTVAYLLKMRFIVVRKHDDRSGHSNTRIEGQLCGSDRCLFIDDFIDSGETKKQVLHVLQKEAEKYSIRPLPIYSAQYLYNDGNGGYRRTDRRGKVLES